MRTAAIGIGSNSLRMLVADIRNGKLHRIKRYREGLRVFAALDEQGKISEDMLDKAADSVKSFADEARLRGAEEVHLFATSAVRDATNQDELIKRLEGKAGLNLEICSGDTEALLSFIGATDGEKAGLIDIGGGSTELAIGGNGKIADCVSLQMGAVRLFRMKPIVSAADAYSVADIARDILAPVKARFENASVSDGWIGVGGTFTTTAAFILQIPCEYKEHIHGFVFNQKNLQHAIEQLAPMPYEQRLQLPYLQPQRADIVVHGMAILYACMKELNIDKITVSEYGNLEGFLKLKYSI